MTGRFGPNSSPSADAGQIGLRWQLADEERDGQPALFGVDELIGPAAWHRQDVGPGVPARDREADPQPGAGRLAHAISAGRSTSTAAAAMRCVYCFARPTHEYLGLNLGEDFDRKIVVKINAVEKLRAELADPQLDGRAGRDGHQHRPLPTLRGQVQAHPRRGRGADRARQPVLDPDQVGAGAARSRPADRGREAGRRHASTSRSARWTSGSGGPPSPARRTRAAGSRRCGSWPRAGIRTGALIAPILPGLSATGANSCGTWSRRSRAPAAASSA